jgi:ABC-type antimicrobial peptide transport system ATPase subunit
MHFCYSHIIHSPSSTEIVTCDLIFSIASFVAKSASNAVQQSIKAVNPKGEVINTVGSGDSTVAGMVAGLATGLLLFTPHQVQKS